MTRIVVAEVAVAVAMLLEVGPVGHILSTAGLWAYLLERSIELGICLRPVEAFRLVEFVRGVFWGVDPAGVP